MPAEVVLNLLENNTDTFNLSFTQDATGDPEDLTGVTVELYFKPDASTANDDPSVTKLTSPDDVTIVNAAAGSVQFVVPPEVVVSPGSTFWRCDLVVGENRRTAGYGAVVTKDL